MLASRFKVRSNGRNITKFPNLGTGTNGHTSLVVGGQPHGFRNKRKWVFRVRHQHYFLSLIGGNKGNAQSVEYIRKICCVNTLERLQGSGRIGNRIGFRDEAFQRWPMLPAMEQACTEVYMWYLKFTPLLSVYLQRQRWLSKTADFSSFRHLYKLFQALSNSSINFWQTNPDKRDSWFRNIGVSIYKDYMTAFVHPLKAKKSMILFLKRISPYSNTPTIV